MSLVLMLLEPIVTDDILFEEVSLVIAQLCFESNDVLHQLRIFSCYIFVRTI